MTSRRPRGRLREEILQTADDLLVEFGDARDVSIEAVVDRVRCTPPALYYYFPSKEHLLYEVCELRYREFAEALDSSVADKTDPISELVGRGHGYLDWAVEHPEHYRILFMAPAMATPEGESTDPRESAGLAELIGNLERAIAAGLLVEGDTLEMAVVLWSVVHGIASLVVANRAISLPFAHRVLDTTSRAVLAGWRKSPG